MVTVGPTQAFPSKQEGIYSERLLERLGRPRLKEEPLEQRHMDLAYSAQKTLERAVIELVAWLHKETGSRNLCIAGGVGLNCVMNQRLLALPFVDRVFVQPAASDAGTAIGAALEVVAENGIRPEAMEHVYTGPSFTNEEIRKALDSFKVPYRREEDVCRFAAEKLAQGCIVAWFQGAMEFGPRALGNRSILADARDPAMKDRINATIKFREDFRPFAPAVLEEKVADYFHGGVTSPFMTLTFDVREEKRSQIASITHVDGTARIQTVGAKTNPRFHRLISEFEQITGDPHGHQHQLQREGAAHRLHSEGRRLHLLHDGDGSPGAGGLCPLQAIACSRPSFREEVFQDAARIWGAGPPGPQEAGGGFPDGRRDCRRHPLSPGPAAPSPGTSRALDARHPPESGPARVLHHRAVGDRPGIPPCRTPGEWRWERGSAQGTISSCSRT